MIGIYCITNQINGKKYTVGADPEVFVDRVIDKRRRAIRSD